ncbi:MAG: NUDIX domain-containing protein [Leadbetterella sp.]|nr:NUDIX domain-containing protein [Leadbetterella sp.]
MKTRPSAIILSDNNLLTLKYNYNGNLLYAIPGGNLEFGEKLKEALERELQEEIGLVIEVQNLLFLAEVHQQNKDTLHCVFNTKIVSGIPQLNPKETTALEICWIPIETIEDYNLYPNIKTQIKEHFIEAKDHQVFLGEISQPWF